jgi:hypothetical protein
MAATCTTTKEIIEKDYQNIWTEITFTWVSHTDGTVSGVGASNPLLGIISGVWFYPDSGATQPTDAYDVTLLDEYGRDVLYGVGANVSQDQNNSGNYRVPMNADGMSVILRGNVLTPSITNAGSGKGGTIILQLR